MEEYDKYFDDVHNKWKDYREAKADFTAMKVPRATVQPMITFGVLKELTDLKIKQVKKEIENIASH